uniref:Elongation of very long chain fatty acids protein n=2 Tax=Parasteatoda tepidariorum TaxID=114398 RepID=A0A2L2YE57_PARTP
MTILKYMKEQLESGDPTIRSWVLVDSYYMPFLLSAIYVLFIKKIGPAFMENRKPFMLRNVMIVYNFCIVIAYAACILLLAYFFLTTDAYSKICAPTVVEINDYTYWATGAGWCIYILKYIEFADTVFFVLRKKNYLITNLHVIHHSSLPILCWIFLRTETSGFQFIPAVINAFVHIIMYTYYGLAAMGPKYQKYLWWKQYLTKIQMLQFIVVLIFVLVIIPLTGCKTSQHAIYIDIFFAILFLGLFYNFYTKTYSKPLHTNGKVEMNGNVIHAKENGGSKNAINRNKINEDEISQSKCDRRRVVESSSS